MRIDKIEIQNFRCFERQLFEFAPKTTVFIGKNGTGKSTLLRAIANALSFIFNKSQNSWGYSSLAKEVSDLSVNNINIREVHHNGEIADFVSLKAWARFDDANVGIDEYADIQTWEMNKNSFESSTLKNSLYKDAYISFRECIEMSDRYPLLVLYSDRYPHINTNLGKNIQSLLNQEDFIGRTWGYYHWCEFTSCAEIWQRRFIKVFNRLSSFDNLIHSASLEEGRIRLINKREAFQQEIDYITQILKKFTSNELEGLSDRSVALRIDSVIVDGATDFNIKFVFADGVERYWYELPAGLERLISIVFDMAYRSFILNNGKVEPNGVVMIDEIDLHLHPSLEQDVLTRFRQTFPNVQFIVATHSPLVITNLRQQEENLVCRMSRYHSEYSHQYIGEMYGMDYDLALSEVMDTEPRNVYVTSLKNRYIRQRLRGADDMAALTLNELRQVLSVGQMEIMMKEIEEAL